MVTNAEGRYRASGSEAEYEPGARGRVLRNRLGIRRVYEMQAAESRALDAAQEWAISHFDRHHRFTAGDIRLLHRQWLGKIYDWAGEHRSVNLSRGDFMFAAAAQLPRLMAGLDREVLRHETPCAGMDTKRLAIALARVHAELILIHPFREGNGRCARLLGLLMAMQAGLPTLDFWGFSGKGKRRYVAAIHAAIGRNYAPLEACFSDAISRTCAAFEGKV